MTLYDDIRRTMSHVPKRRQKTIAVPVLQAMNEAYIAIVNIETDPVKGTLHMAETRFKAILRAKQAIAQIQKPLYVYWNISMNKEDRDVKYKSSNQRKHLCERFNYILAILRDMELKSTKYDKKNDTGEIKIMYFTATEINNALFLSKLRDLHRMTHSKLARLNAIYRDAEAALAYRFVDDAFYYAVQGNKFRPNNQADYLIRKEYFRKAIDALYHLDRALFNVFSIGNYSDKEITVWGNLLNEALKLLQAVNNGDKKRYEQHR